MAMILAIMPTTTKTEDSESKFAHASKSYGARLQKDSQISLSMHLGTEWIRLPYALPE
jgi:hypothetical protein